MVDGVATLTAVRFLAGLGLGGAMPNAAALTAEFVPARQRPLAITLTIVCIPVGGVLAGVAAGNHPGVGWRVLFAAGGLVPLLLAVILFKLMPESPRFLAGAGAMGRAESRAAEDGSPRRGRHGVCGCRRCGAVARGIDRLSSLRRRCGATPSP